MKLMIMPSVATSSPFSIGELSLRFQRIRTNWWANFAQASSITRIPIEILIAKSAVESAGLQQTSNAIYVGLMQIGKATIQDALNFLCGTMYADGRRWKAPDWLIQNAKPIILKYLPSFTVANSKSFNPQLAFSIAASKNGAEFNVLMGSIYLFILMSNPKFLDRGLLRLDKVMSAYNTGPNYSFYKTPTSDTAQLVNVIRNSGLSQGKKIETSRHILKFCGVDGAFDLLLNHKFSFN